MQLRVFCPLEGESVPLAVCEACASQIEREGGVGEGFVECGPSVSELHVRAVAASIGTMVSAPARAVRDAATLATAVSALAEAGAEPVLVVNAEGTVVGSLSRTEMARARAAGGLLAAEVLQTAGEVMSEARVVVETESVGDVLRAMANRRLRHIAIVAADGSPLGVISDVEALRLFAGMR
ncbi:MAG: CBS domain-containing protein [Polyangiaceae bacterium]